ncbi:1-deoxy-D-xylulose-5-phosphate reductoisomerase [Actinobacteria bacterium IMCC26103]|nr:1-deoxy-D-xylulose-5-phosphate reductoisomerase [Actinobacteria bacterium IMCC26103]
MKDLVILGSTGSIGVQALEILEDNPSLFRVVAITSAGNNPALLVEQAKKFKVPVIGVTKGAELIKSALPEATIIDGPGASTEIAAITCDVVLNGITGSIGLGPTLAALKVGNRVALANKESLVAGGDLVMSIAKPNQLLPVDSEHSALWQCLMGGKKSEVTKLVLTASGGPFRERKDLSEITVGEALSHPTWAMGPVVTINSATLVNKGLEIIEAHYLFDLPYSQIEAVIHPQSVIHSMVQYIDGSTIAQASPPNMKGPISLAINYPDRVPSATPAVDWTNSHNWSFHPIDNEKFPAIDLARRCGTLGGGLPAIFNAANEVCVAAFIDGKIGFTSIIETVEEVVQSLGSKSAGSPRDLADVSAIENDARKIAQELLVKVAR